tara:strand:+ start:221 stop:565 length:345 start_codon:yes stop_codon:yes gene_type:complete
MFSSPSYAEWEKVSENIDGDTFYVDFDRIRKVNGFVYFWQLTDYLKPSPWGDFSFKWYNQGDCKLFRLKTLSISTYSQPMGKGEPVKTDNTPKEWINPPPNSSLGVILNAVCNR